MQQAIENSFPQIVGGTCLERLTTSFEIFDNDSDPRRCYVRKNLNEQVHFAVKNPRNIEIHFLAIDKCIFTDLGPSRCDCAVFTESDFCFLEIKFSKKLGQRKRARETAQKQLQNTIYEFIKANISFHRLQLKAIICIVGNNSYPVARAESLNAVVDFLDKFNAELLVGNEITLL
ncbi:hypothetical protein L0657_00720 [Dyadobacter sp. CY345]|uniref:hypothetical protein n=1 Tax=Dyadobacter sp. CY345 TaxID=2909335 RepID=UPI001F15B25C|nr:hypothetical protein [Dyadobacter sp. CY345]MCF2442458.1 hypothetical protein [Dyadobacter sp. CY345]